MFNLYHELDRKFIEESIKSRFVGCERALRSALSEVNYVFLYPSCARAVLAESNLSPNDAVIKLACERGGYWLPFDQEKA
jgi:hypothetical protein